MTEPTRQRDRTAPASCRVCGDSRPIFFLSAEGRDYWRCPLCRAVLLDAAQLPDPQTEYARYLLHRNELDDLGYRAFLGRLAGPLLERLGGPGLEGLDFGCGPGPALARMLEDAGHRVALFDPFFHPDPAVLARTYDFIVCTEAAEHFHQPLGEFRRMNRLLRPGGWLGLMTCFQTDDARFAAWHYRRDVTHVTFYRRETFQRLAAHFGWDCEIPAKDLVFMRKPPVAQKSGPPAPLTDKKI